MITFTEENYLKNLLLLSMEHEGVSVLMLSKKLGIKMPTVTSMMKKFAVKGFVYFSPYKQITLTASGKSEALLVLRKHRLTETFLTRVMGIGWEEVHSIAEQIEHIQSPLFFGKMDEMLHYPETDPHGEPIPTKEGVLIQQPKMRLSACRVGETVRLTGVNDSSKEFLTFLNSKGLKPGVRGKIEHVEPYDSSLTIICGDRKEVLSKTIADKVLVELM